MKQRPDCREAMVNLLIGNVFRVHVDGLFEALGERITLPDARELEQAI